MKKKNLIGQKFEKLTVISAAPNIFPKTGNGRSFTAWNCQCECGNIIVVRTGTLTGKLQKSCGCHISQFGIAIKPGQKFNKLTTITYDNGYWNCLCECGNTTTALTHHLLSNNTKSCGCLKVETTRKNQKLSLPVVTKFEPRITSARRLWRQYCYQDKLCDLTFDQWFNVSQKDCFYCGANPYSTYNYFITKADAIQETKNKGYFIYNGLDRTDNSLPHTLSNVVPCCPICNRAKAERTIEEFHKYITTLKIDDFTVPTKLLTLPQGYLLVSVKIAYRHYLKNYKTMEIDLPTFYTLSQLPCFYCDAEKTNYFNVYLKDKKASQSAKNGAHFYYNGIDRLDNTKTHTIENVAPCCYYCNFAKGKLALPEFQAWIKRVKDFRQSKLVNNAF
jgi:hypothetical protein